MLRLPARSLYSELVLTLLFCVQEGDVHVLQGASGRALRSRGADRPRDEALDRLDPCPPCCTTFAHSIILSIYNFLLFPFYWIVESHEYRPTVLDERASHAGYLVLGVHCLSSESVVVFYRQCWMMARGGALSSIHAGGGVCEAGQRETV